MAEIIDGKAVAARFKYIAKTRAAKFESEHGRRVGLAVVRVGDDPASGIYVRNKVRACEECGVASYVHVFDETVPEDRLIEFLHELNADDKVDGILVQLPLPRHINERACIAAISPSKDADGFNAVNAGKLFLNERGGAVSCTPRGIIELIKSTGVPIAGKHAVVIGRSNIVGKPIAALLLNNDATVTVCHSKTQNLAEYTRRADILVVAVGKKHFVTADMIKPGATVIDVGMNRDESGLYGDVDFEAAKRVADYITPVPGGVGPMTVAMLILNTVDGACNE
ncbi:MAG: bifunctional methylenetetrahydrofolate dehydrogenase/methenyltetrahydrofolate cyclohydrolase FolD [Clostridia bacterium]|nr:bifunctional methylenetetrahydrofolate dehydrogenase/methenyltetrahydrofolate cyclohydrolase FolD [Clostridia bacterium]